MRAKAVPGSEGHLENLPGRVSRFKHADTDTRSRCDVQAQEPAGADPGLRGLRHAAPRQRRAHNTHDRRSCARHDVLSETGR